MGEDDATYEAGNYPVRWNEDTTQVALDDNGATVPAGDATYTKSTLDGKIILAAKADVNDNSTVAGDDRSPSVPPTARTCARPPAARATTSSPCASICPRASTRSA